MAGNRTRALQNVSQAANQLNHSEGPGFDSQPWQFIICIYFHVLLHDLFHYYYYYYYLYINRRVPTYYIRR